MAWIKLETVNTFGMIFFSESDDIKSEQPVSSLRFWLEIQIFDSEDVTLRIYNL